MGNRKAFSVTIWDERRSGSIPKIKGEVVRITKQSDPDEDSEMWLLDTGYNILVIFDEEGGTEG